MCSSAKCDIDSLACCRHHSHYAPLLYLQLLHKLLLWSDTPFSYPQTLAASQSCQFSAQLLAQLICVSKYSSFSNLLRLSFRLVLLFLHPYHRSHSWQHQIQAFSKLSINEIKIQSPFLDTDRTLEGLQWWAERTTDVHFLEAKNLKE